MKNNLENILYRKNKGFTLAETVVTIFVFSLLMMGTTLLLRDVFLTSRTETLSTNNVDQARKTANTFVNEIRNSTGGVNGAYTINAANDNSMTFFSTAILNNGMSSKIRYYISNGVLYKGVTNPSGSPLAYTGTEVITTITKDLSLGSNPLFTYYDGDYDGTTNPLTQPVNVTQVKFVKINLTVLRQTIQNSSNTFTVSAGASFRNLKTNLGN